MVLLRHLTRHPMIRTFIILTLTFITLLTVVTAINPAAGFQLATYVGIALAQPISIALKLGLALRGAL